jgi:hypothetical protein
MVRGSRERLWAHNLGASESAVSRWAPADFLAQWDAVAAANEKLAQAGRLKDMAGEGIVPYDWSASRGQKHSAIPDALARLDFDIHRELIGEEEGPRVA